MSLFCVALVTTGCNALDDSTAVIMGEQGANQAYLLHGGPVIMFPSPTSVHLSFFVDPDTISRNQPLIVCYRKHTDDPAVQYSDSASMDTADDNCTKGNNQWRQVMVTSQKKWMGYPAASSGYTVSRNWIYTYGGMEDSAQALNVVFSDYTLDHYRVAVSSLEADTLYEYRIAYGTRRLANRVLFLTPPAPGATQHKRLLLSSPTDTGVASSALATVKATTVKGPPSVKFVAFSDLRSYDGDAAQIKVRNLLTRQALAQRMQFAILPGDISNSTGTSQQYYEYYFNFYRQLMTTIPFYPIHGNHDLMKSSLLDAISNNGYHFFHLMDLPSNPSAEVIEHKDVNEKAVHGYRSFYSFNWGDIHFMALDVPDFDNPGFNGISKGTPLYNWLERDLQKHQGMKWRIAYFHQPPDSPDKRSPAMKDLMELLARGKVHLIVSGHWEAPDGNVEAAGDVPWVVTPSGGARNRYYEEKATCARDGINKFGAMRFDVNQERLSGQWLNEEGNVSGEFVITQDSNNFPVGKLIHFDRSGC